MSISSSGSVHSAGSSFAPGGVDPERLSDLAHTTAASLLDRVHHTEDPQVVSRVLTLVDVEGVDLVAELWSHAEPDSLPGILWRLYMLRTWMTRDRESISRLWRVGEPVATAASAIAGVDQAPTEDDIARTADSILSGAFMGDFAVALERAGAFCDVMVAGLATEAKRRNARLSEGASSPAGADSSTVASTEGHVQRAAIARMLHHAASLRQTAADFRHGAALWRRDKLE
ncbi:hypothetical protein [Bifidobacterium avesanii]|uniref:hypothetical protein n=1 Tax=Bifidobacterium avesanii TaxID=1798157 RepID=UPI001F1018F0|nr:hypothetical protein [Bifidobacterium avesanii]